MTNDPKQFAHKVNNEILGLLDKDCRLSHRELGRKLGRSPLTIKKHIDELENKEIIKGYNANIDYDKLGYNIIAFVEITISKGKMLEVENNIANDPNVFAVYDITGTYDALILARFKNREELSEMIKNIHASQYIERTNTHLVLNVIKESSSYISLLEKESKKEINIQ